HNRDRADPSIDIIEDIAAFFGRSLDIAAKAGVPRENIVLDPGIGFGKTHEQSMITLARLSEFGSFGLPLLVGASRKLFIASVSPIPCPIPTWSRPRPRPSRTPITSFWNAQPARWPMPS